MLFLNKSLSILLLLAALSAVYCDDEMSLHVEIINPNLDVDENGEKLVDLCEKVKCDVGEKCVVVDNQASCECIESCEIPEDERQKVCSSSNQTFESDCHFLRQRCWCKRTDPKCVDSSVLNDKLDYYGECRYIGDCSALEQEVFPSRMKQWLNEVLHILNQRKDLEPKYLSLVKLADQLKEKKVEKYWTAGVAFEFCQLDKSKDHVIQKEELYPLISSIKALENCIQPFLNGCDLNNDDLISDNEWGKCLDLSDEDMILLRKYC